jgi:hypothetical protein
VQRGPLGPDEALRLMHGLRRGWRDGQTREIGQTPPLPAAKVPFLPYPGRPDAAQIMLSGRSWQRAALHDRARAAVADGRIVTVFCLSPTALYHRMQFHPAGFWEQTGGQFGRSDRTGPLIRPLTLKQRVARERARLSDVRRFESPG